MNLRGTQNLMSVCVLLALNIGCNDLPHPYPVIWAGKYVEVGAPIDLPICGGTLVATDQMAAGIRHDMGYSFFGDKIRYYYLSADELEDLGACKSGVACTKSPGIIYAPFIPEAHELAHAVRGFELARGERKRTPSLFEEGLAHSYGAIDLVWPSEPDFDITEKLTVDTRPLPTRYFEPAAHFISYLEEQYGKHTVVGFIDSLRPRLSQAGYETVFEQVTGEPLRSAVDGYADYPRCSHFAQSSHPYECGQSPVVPDSDGIVRVASTIDCANNDTVGPVWGRMWRDYVIEIAEPGTYGLNVENEDLEAPVQLELTACDDRCSTPVDFSTNGDERLTLLDLPAGSYLMRISRDANSAGSVTVRVVPPSRLGYEWCSQTPHAAYVREDSMIIDLDPPATGCTCVDETTHSDLLAERGISDSLIVESNAAKWLLDVRNAAWESTWSDCVRRVPETALSTTCSDAAGNPNPGLFYDNLDPEAGNPIPIFPYELIADGDRQTRCFVF